VAIMRAITAVPGHAFTGAIMGYYVGQARFRPDCRSRLIWTGFIIAVLLHGFYDTPILTMKAMMDGTPRLPKSNNEMAGLLILVMAVVLVVEWAWAVKVTKRARYEQWARAQHQIAMAQAAALAAAQPPALPGLPAVPVPPLPPLPPIYTPAPVGGSRLASGLMVAFGGLLASIGGMVLLGLALSYVLGQVQPDERVGVVVGAVMIGVLPAGLGLALFTKGIQRLNARPVTSH